MTMAIADTITPPARPFARVALIVLGANVTPRALTDLPAGRKPQQRPT